MNSKEQAFINDNHNFKSSYEPVKKDTLSQKDIVDKLKEVENILEYIDKRFDKGTANSEKYKIMLKQESYITILALLIYYYENYLKNKAPSLELLDNNDFIKEIKHKASLFNSYEGRNSVIGFYKQKLYYTEEYIDYIDEEVLYTILYKFSAVSIIDTNIKSIKNDILDRIRIENKSTSGISKEKLIQT